MRLRRRIQLLFLALFLILLAGVGTDTLLEIRRNDAARTMNEQLVPARDELNALLTSLVDQETGERGYLLTGREEFLRPYRDGRQQAAASLTRLRHLLADDSGASAGIDRISSWRRTSRSR